MSVVEVSRLPVASPLSFTDSNGSLLIRYMERYQVITDNPSDSGFVVVKAAGLPQYNDKILVETGHELICKSVIPEQDLTAKKKWEISCDFFNQVVDPGYDVSPFQTFSADPEIDPTSTPSRIRVAYKTEQKEVYDASFLYWLHQGVEHPGYHPLAPGSYIGPVINSAGDPIPLTRPESLRTFTVSKVFRNWNTAWDAFTGSINSTAFTLTRADDEGIRASWSFPARTMKMDLVDPREQWINGKLYFDVTFTMSESPDPAGWLHHQPDVGVNWAVFEGQYKNKTSGTTERYTLTEQDDFDLHVEALTDSQDIPIVDPIRLNGYGRAAGYHQPFPYNADAMFVGVWKKFLETDFGAHVT